MSEGLDILDSPENAESAELLGLLLLSKAIADLSFELGLVLEEISERLTGDCCGEPGARLEEEVLDNAGACLRLAWHRLSGMRGVLQYLGDAVGTLEGAK